MAPFLANPEHQTVTQTKEASVGGNAAQKPLNSQAEGVKAWKYQMHGHAERCLAKYCELANVPATDFKNVTTPNLDDHQLQPEDFETKGNLAPIASRIVLTALFFAGMIRLDCARTVNTLAREVDKWSVACDERLHRLMFYIYI